MLEDEELTFKIRGCVFEVFRVLGAGFLEKVYENALLIELDKQGLKCECQTPLVVNYKEQKVGEFITDILVEGRVVIELKAVAKILPIHEAQLLNYLKATNKKIGLLVNFTAPKATVKRYISS
jgi:GxxExxY protein